MWYIIGFFISAIISYFVLTHDTGDCDGFEAAMMAFVCGLAWPLLAVFAVPIATIWGICQLLKLLWKIFVDKCDRYVVKLNFEKHFKGELDEYKDLPDDAEQGDIYYLKSTDMYYVRVGYSWDFRRADMIAEYSFELELKES